MRASPSSPSGAPRRDVGHEERGVGPGEAGPQHRGSADPGLLGEHQRVRDVLDLLQPAPEHRAAGVLVERACARAWRRTGRRAGRARSATTLTAAPDPRATSITVARGTSMSETSIVGDVEAELRRARRGSVAADGRPPGAPNATCTAAPAASPRKKPPSDVGGETGAEVHRRERDEHHDEHPGAADRSDQVRREREEERGRHRDGRGGEGRSVAGADGDAERARRRGCPGARSGRARSAMHRRRRARRRGRRGTTARAAAPRRPRRRTRSSPRAAKTFATFSSAVGRPLTTRKRLASTSLPLWAHSPASTAPITPRVNRPMSPGRRSGVPASTGSGTRPSRCRPGGRLRSRSDCPSPRGR